MNKNLNNCNNCGKPGHQYSQCKLPIISYGIILFKYTDNGIKYLMIRRKDSFGFIDFMRGKYVFHNTTQVQNIIDEMSNSEKNRLINNTFENLWRQMWGDVYNIQYKNEEYTCSKKFDLIKNGICIGNEKLTIKDLVERSTTNWDETEWEFPKGRRNYKEKDLECALREFEEETGISKNNITIIENVIPFEEIFIGTNHKYYKHKYFLANYNNNNNDDDINLYNFQTSEVSKMEWKTFDECLNSIRPYNLEKKKLITNINKVLEEYSLYS
jgi:8-oxo-dGTP pyrophosphatase MutT (NUDIX family)